MAIATVAQDGMGNRKSAAATANIQYCFPNLFLQIVAFAPPPSYYDGQDPLAIIFELVSYPADGDPERLCGTISISAPSG